MRRIIVASNRTLRGRMAVVGCCSLITLAATSQSSNAQSLQVDLAKVTGTDTITVGPGTYKIELINRNPRFVYDVSFVDKRVDIPPLTNPGLALAGVDPCSKIKTAINAFTTDVEEEDIPKVLKELKKQKSEADQKVCKEEVDKASALSDSTTVLLDTPHLLRQGWQMTVTVSRHAPEGGKPREWTVVYTTGAPGEWRVTWGYSSMFVTGLAKSGVFKDASGYNTKQLDSASFVIKADHDRSRLALDPVVMFNWAPADAGWLSHSWMAGLGIDLKTPVLLLAYGVAYHSNIVLSTGLAARQEKDLLGKYSVGDTIKTDLEESQLVGNVFRIRPHVSLTFRFSSNPFKKSDDTSADDSKTKPEAPPQTTDKKKADPKKLGGADF